jgi:hypothetical protein
MITRKTLETLIMAEYRMSAEEYEMLAKAMAEVMITEGISLDAVPDYDPGKSPEIYAAANKFWPKVKDLLPDCGLVRQVKHKMDITKLCGGWDIDKARVAFLLNGLLPEHLRGDVPPEPIHPQLAQWLAQTEAKLIALVEEKVRSTVGEYGPQITQATELVVPPRPKTHEGSRKLTVEREKLQGTCDKALFKLFETDRKARGFNVSQMLDFVLFNFFGKPMLSFEQTEDDKEPTRKG